MARKISSKSFIDISNHPIDIRDCLVINDVNREHRYNVQVIEILENTDTMRRFSVQNINSTDPNITVNQVFELHLPRTEPVSGLVIKPDDFLRAEKDDASLLQVGGLAQHTIDALKQFLDNKPESNYRVRFDIACSYLQKLGYLPADNATAKKHLARLCRANPNFKSAGGWISSLTPTYAVTEGGTIVGSNKKIVDFDKLIMGIRYVLESGVLGEIDFRK